MKRQSKHQKLIKQGTEFLKGRGYTSSEIFNEYPIKIGFPRPEFLGRVDLLAHSHIKGTTIIECGNTSRERLFILDCCFRGNVYHFPYERNSWRKDQFSCFLRRKDEIRFGWLSESITPFPEFSICPKECMNIWLEFFNLDVKDQDLGAPVTWDEFYAQVIKPLDESRAEEKTLAEIDRVIIGELFRETDEFKEQIRKKV